MSPLDAATLADVLLDEDAERRIQRCFRAAVRVWRAPLFDRAAEARTEIDPDDEREKRAERREDR